MPEQRTMLSSRAVLARFGICSRSLDRWIVNASLNFPQPLMINSRRYFYLDEIEAWERAQAAKNSTRAVEARVA